MTTKHSQGSYINMKRKHLAKEHFIIPKIFSSLPMVFSFNDLPCQFPINNNL